MPSILWVVSNARSKGYISEEYAVHFLRACGYVIIGTNLYSKYGEIDILTFKNNCYHIFEVKSVRINNHQNACTVTRTKLSRIIQTFLSLYPSRSHGYILHVLLIEWDRNGRYITNTDLMHVSHEDWY